MQWLCVFKVFVFTVITIDNNYIYSLKFRIALGFFIWVSLSIRLYNFLKFIYRSVKHIISPFIFHSFCQFRKQFINSLLDIKYSFFYWYRCTRIDNDEYTKILILNDNVTHVLLIYDNFTMEDNTYNIMMY